MVCLPRLFVCRKKGRQTKKAIQIIFQVATAEKTQTYEEFFPFCKAALLIAATQKAFLAKRIPHLKISCIPKPIAGSDRAPSSIENGQKSYGSENILEK